MFRQLANPNAKVPHRSPRKALTPKQEMLLQVLRDLRDNNTAVPLAEIARRAGYKNAHLLQDKISDLTARGLL